MEIVTLTKMVHKGETRIRIDFPYDAPTIQVIKQLPGRKWSQSKKCWHLSYTKEAYALLQQHFEISLPFEIPATSVEKEDISKEKKATVFGIQQVIPKNEPVIKVLPEHDFRVKVLVPYQRKDWIEKIKRLPDRAWNAEQQYWSVPKTDQTLNLLKTYFGKVLQIDTFIIWDKKLPTANKNMEVVIPLDKETIAPLNERAFIPETDFPPASLNKSSFCTNFQKKYKEIKQYDKTYKVFLGEIVRIEMHNANWLKVYVPFDKKGWVAIVKEIPGRKWEEKEKYWLIPYVQDSIEHLVRIESSQLSFSFKIKKELPKEFALPKRKINKTRSSLQLNSFQEKALLALEDKLRYERRQYSTIKTYKYHLKGLLLAYPKVKPSLISAKQIERHILQLVKKKKISISAHNQLVNAYKAFYNRVLGQTDKVQYLYRPKKQRKLPNVLSKEEMELLIKSIDNLKHRTMIILVYAAGLRRSEVLNLRLKDILFSRKCIFVKDSKGGKDRYVMLAPKAETILRTYMKAYKPKYWLFVGQTGGRYSASSIQSVFESARAKSKVNPYITIHGLRHSFATHLHEAGVPLNVIKDLLGHSSIKTTEVYLHISTKFMKKIQSPLESLNLDL